MTVHVQFPLESVYMRFGYILNSASELIAPLDYRWLYLQSPHRLRLEVYWSDRDTDEQCYFTWYPGWFCCLWRDRQHYQPNAWFRVSVEVDSDSWRFVSAETGHVLFEMCRHAEGTQFRLYPQTLRHLLFAPSESLQQVMR